MKIETLLASEQASKSDVLIKIQEYSQNEFEKLESIWKSIYDIDGIKKGELSPFQSWEWYSQLNQQYLVSGDVKGKIVYLVAFENKSPVMIAPIIIVKYPFNSILKKFNLDNGAYIFGKFGYTDYLNFIYSDFSESAFEEILKYIKTQLKCKKIYLHQILDNTSMKEYLENNYSTSLKLIGDCARIEVQNSYEDYLKSLSKSSRQNIRTANNRAKKDGFKFVYKKLKNLSEKDAYEFYNIYMTRQESKHKSRKKTSFIKSVIRIYRDMKRKISMKKYNIIVNSLEKLDNCFFIGFYEENSNEKVGFCFGVENKQTVCISAVCFDERYRRYSPGIVCISQYINDMYNENDVKVFDLTRGSEKYKYQIGASEHKIYYYDIAI